MKRLILVMLMLLCGGASAVNLDGRIVILLVSAHRTGDPRMEAVKSELLKMRQDLGYDTESMPVVFMGFEDSDTERKYFDRLGFQAFDSPVLCVVEWGNPARFGPKRVLDYAIARSATPQHVDFIVKNYLKTVEDPGSLEGPALPPPLTDTDGLEIQNVRFEASGQPLYLTNVAVRLRNNTDLVARDVTLRFFCKTSTDEGWRLMGKKVIDKLLPGNIASRDIVGDTRNFGLVNAENNSIRCYYRVEVEQGGKVIHQEGEFIPYAGPGGMK